MNDAFQEWMKRSLRQTCTQSSRRKRCLTPRVSSRVPPLKFATAVPSWFNATVTLPFPGAPGGNTDPACKPFHRIAWNGVGIQDSISLLRSTRGWRSAPGFDLNALRQLGNADVIPDRHPKAVRRQVARWVACTKAKYRPGTRTATSRCKFQF